MILNDLPIQIETPKESKEEYRKRMALEHPPSPLDKLRPAHYQGDKVMKIIEDFDLDLCKGTAVKYILRAGKKEGESEKDDLMKALWYLERRLLQLRTCS